MVVREVTLGYHIPRNLVRYTTSWKRIRRLLDNEYYPDGRLLFTLSDYLLKYLKKFDAAYIYTDPEYDITFPDGTAVGVSGAINRSEVDISGNIYDMDENSTSLTDFSYPYRLSSDTFMTHKPKYKPQLFGILQTFSFPVWIATIFVLVTMFFLYHVILKQRDSLDKILIHVFAVLLRQSSILKPSSMAERMLVYAWVVGAMFLCLAYESVFFSFLAVPPVTRIKDVSQLAKAVEKGEYHCVASVKSHAFKILKYSEQKNFKIIGRDLMTNNLVLNYTNVESNFLSRKRNTQNLALIVSRKNADRFNLGEFFVSDDDFSETMSAMSVRKGFCCKKILERFVHKMMASGLYFKYWGDKAFLYRMKASVKHSQQDRNERKLILTDLAPAFIFLLTGHLISFIVLIWEILVDRRTNVNFRKRKNKKTDKICNEDIL